MEFVAYCNAPIYSRKIKCGVKTLPDFDEIALEKKMDQKYE